MHRRSRAKACKFRLSMSISHAQDSDPGTPILVYLSPGVDVAASVEALGQSMGFTAANGKYASVSLGQGQVRPDRPSAHLSM
jgi:hypothetical protein